MGNAEHIQFKKNTNKLDNYDYEKMCIQWKISEWNMK